MNRFLRVLRFLLLSLSLLFALTIVVLAGFRIAAALRESKSRAEAAPSTGHFVSGGDVEMFVQEAGPPDGPPVILIHGTGAWSQIWRPTIDTLAASGYRAIAIDLPPFGFSERPNPPTYDDASQGERIVAVLDALGLRDVVLVGHSFGGRPTVEAALNDPSRVRLLVLVDAALDPTTTAPPPVPPVVRTLVSNPRIRNPFIAATLTNPWFTRKLFQQLILDPDDATDVQVKMVRDQFPVEGTTAALGDWVERFLLAGIRSRNDDPASYPALRMPVLLIWGEADAVTPLARAHRVKELLPNASLDTLPSTGHIPAVESPELFHASLLGFLAAHPPLQP